MALATLPAPRAGSGDLASPQHRLHQDRDFRETRIKAGEVWHRLGHDTALNMSVRSDMGRPLHSEYTALISAWSNAPELQRLFANASAIVRERFIAEMLRGNRQDNSERQV
jgi:hypothetical protein